MDPLGITLWLAVATASISYTLTKTPMFEWAKTWFGRWPMGNEDTEAVGVPAKDDLWHQLWECPYCMAHWVAFFFVIVFHPMPFTGTVIDLLPVAFIIVTVSALLVQAMILISKLLSLIQRLLD